MNTKYLAALILGALVIDFAAAGSADAGWGRYRVTTHYGTPSAPVIRETVVMHGAFRPLVVAPAPIVVSSAPITAYYAAPAVFVPSPRAAARAAYYAPAPQIYYYAPAPATYYYRGYPLNSVILP